jgi:hypothetical protein
MEWELVIMKDGKQVIIYDLEQSEREALEESVTLYFQGL